MVKVGIVGFGKMGKIREKVIRSNGCGQVVSVFDTNTSIDFKGYHVVQSPEEIITSTDIEAVFIATPNHLNGPLTVQALSSGKHVFCEKPPACNAKDMEEIRGIAAASGKKLMYGFNHRHHSSIKYMKNLIDSGEYGKILWMRGRYGKSVDKDFLKTWRSKKEMAGGGIFLDQGIHMLDLFLYIGGQFDEVKSFVSNLYWEQEIEDNVFAIFRNNQTGMVASLHSTMTQWRHLFSFEVFLEKGYMVLNGLKTTSGTYGDEVLSIAKNRTAAPAATWEDEERITYNTEGFWRSEVDHFMEAITQDRPVEIGSADDALILMRMVDKVYQDSSRRGS